ncbi:hypothetical protein KQI68_00535 [Peptoniphilus sp. MSJ-1]|uniref:DUF4367 domain-containing protein n=1 Tax=Peptoniphilus ovalis TaxID=2841503 RepID=A0ABS6FDR8_9FIRM|nr:hypothetical protein [Peptoniphilus ovalis]MBU5668317.1 hypothetical protein [Peptoniphilus ovalis]
MNNFDKKLKNELNKIAEDTYPSDFVKNKIDLKIENMKKGEHKMKKNKLAIVACAALVLSIGVYATGKITGTISSSSSNYNYTEYIDVEKAENKAGFDAEIPENLGDYKFDGITMVKMADLDEKNNEINKRKAIDVAYKNESDKEITLHIDRIFDNQEPLSKEPHMEMRNINGINFYYTRLESLFLSNGAELTDVEKERMEKDPFFNVGYGDIDGEREKNFSKHILFEKDGLKYSLMTDDSMDVNEYFDIASSIIK